MLLRYLTPCTNRGVGWSRGLALCAATIYKADSNSNLLGLLMEGGGDNSAGLCWIFKNDSGKSTGYH
jgi:hypothetical protein